VAKWMASSSQTATRGVTWGRPSARTVEIQKRSALSSTRLVSSQSVATAFESLKRESSVVSGPARTGLIVEDLVRFAIDAFLILLGQVAGPLRLSSA